MNWNDCKKCPKELCENIYKSGPINVIYSGINFEIDPPCISEDLFFIWRAEESWHKIPLVLNNIETFNEVLYVLLEWQGLQLEDAIRLTKIKSEL